MHVYSPGAGAVSPQGDKSLISTERPYHFTLLLQVSKKSLLSDFIYSFIYFYFFLYSFFHDLHIAPGQGAYSSQG